MSDPVRTLKPLLFILCLVPLSALVYAAWLGALGANPIEAVTRSLGDWALRLLLLTLALTPLRRLTKWNWLTKLRRMLGLYTFFYASLHLLSYIVLDQFFYWPEIWADIIKRPYITVGMVSYLLLIPLAITSTNGWVRRLGRNWKRLHRLVYVISAGAILHFYMLVKADIREPLLYMAIFTLLMLLRYGHTSTQK